MIDGKPIGVKRMKRTSRRTNTLVCIGVVTVLACASGMGISAAQAQEPATNASVDNKDMLVDREMIRECSSEGLRSIAWSLNLREQALKRRERTLDLREADLKKTQIELQRWIGELETVRDQLISVQTSEDDQVSGLVEMVENMRPKNAAGVLVQMDQKLAVRVIDAMDRSKAGKAMAVMEPEKAAKLAENLTRFIEIGDAQ